MIDFHNHILPNVDDGPKTLEESIDMLKYANSQGITEVVQTVHFQHPKMDNKNVEFNYLTKEVNKLQKIIDEKNINIKIHLSAEVFYMPNLLSIYSNPLTTFGNGKYMLIEFTNNIYPTGYEEEFYKLQSVGITPIVAHPERYRFVQNDINILNVWLERGYIIQIDAGSIIGQFGNKVQKFTLNMIDNGFIHIIGSDAHNTKKRNFCLKDSYNAIEKIYSIDLSNELKNNVKKIKKGKNISNIELLSPLKKMSYLKERILKVIKLWE